MASNCRHFARVDPDGLVPSFLLGLGSSSFSFIQSDRTEKTALHYWTTSKRNDLPASPDRKKSPVHDLLFLGITPCTGNLSEAFLARTSCVRFTNWTSWPPLSPIHRTALLFKHGRYPRDFTHGRRRRLFRPASASCLFSADRRLP